MTTTTYVWSGPKIKALNLRLKTFPSSSLAMRNTLIFPGNSCPGLTAKICENLGMQPASAELTQFANVSAPFACASCWSGARAGDTGISATDDQKDSAGNWWSKQT